MSTTTSPSRAGSHRPRVLIAEDEALIRLDLSSLLQQRGWDVCGEARNGREAVRLARDLQPDVALMDIRMPVIDGIEATRLIQAERRTPVVVMTAYDRPSLLARSIVAGATSFVLKPFAEDEIVDSVASAPARLGPAARATARSRRAQTSRRAEIVAVAKRGFAAKGYEATTTEDIAGEVGLLKGSLYHHIDSKQELLSTIVEEFLAAAAVARRHAAHTRGGPRRRLQVFTLARRALHALDRDGSAILSRCTTSLGETRLRSVREAAAADRRFLADLLREGQADDSFQLPGDPDSVAALILDLVAAPLPRSGWTLDDTAVDATAASYAAFVLAAVDGTLPRERAVMGRPQAVR